MERVLLHDTGTRDAEASNPGGKRPVNPTPRDFDTSSLGPRTKNLKDILSTLRSCSFRALSMGFKELREVGLDCGPYAPKQPPKSKDYAQSPGLVAWYKSEDWLQPYDEGIVPKWVFPKKGVPFIPPKRVPLFSETPK